MPSLDEFVKFCKSCSEYIRIIIEDYREGLSWTLKQDGSRVTDIDFRIEDYLRGQIASKFPGHGIFGEERDPINTSSEIAWILDPIDGTYGFSKGSPLFGTLIGLTFKGVPHYGYMYLPFLHNTWLAGDCKKILKNGKPFLPKSFSGWKESLILTTDQQTLAHSEILPYWQKAIDLGSTARTWGDCYGYYLLSLGEASLVADVGLKPCDIIPLVPIILGSGHEIKQFGSNNYSNIVAARKEVLETLF